MCKFFRPDYAPQYSSDEEEMELSLGHKKVVTLPPTKTDAEKEDRRLKRLQGRLRDDRHDSDDEEIDR